VVQRVSGASLIRDPPAWRDRPLQDGFRFSASLHAARPRNEL